MSDSRPRIEAHYDDLADHWDVIAERPARAKLLWQTLESMLGACSGDRLLDAGCGSGAASRLLSERGVDVVGVDVSQEMLENARVSCPAGSFLRADLGESLPLAADSVDTVLCQHVFSHMESIDRPLAEFGRVLRDGGTLVCSTHNPVFDYVVCREGHHPTVGETDDLSLTLEFDQATPTYGDTERFDVIYNPETVGNRATYYRRSFESIVDPLIDAGFSITALREPTPDEAFRSEHPSLGAALERYPARSLCLRAER